MIPKIPLLGVRRVIAIASGKGGVGKTTVTVNLALALQRLGMKVGIFDADIYGPNVPLMLGVHQRKASKSFMATVRHKDAKPYVKPLQRFGLPLMSVGLLMAEDQVINPPADTVGQLVLQALQDVIWGELDYLLLDLPPAAGQPQEDLIKRVAMQGAVIVTTPQDLSLLDASRSLKLFHEGGVPILGVVENMSYFICPDCEARHEIFQRSAQWHPPGLEGATLLGRIPLTAEISQGINKANPLMRDRPDSPQAEAFIEIAAVLQQQLEQSA